MQNKQPFERVVAEHGATVLRVCRAVLGPHTDADDAWSETFLAALRAWPALPADANVQAWLVTIAHRKAIDVIRRRAREPVPLHAVADAASETGISDARDQDLRRALLALPERQRWAIACHHLIGMPYAEIAELLGGTAAAARRAAADGLASLRERLDAHPPAAAHASYAEREKRGHDDHGIEPDPRFHQQPE